jgi:hypothetical protein
VEPVYKVCPDCSVDFLPTISRCSDCGTALVWPSDVPQLTLEPLAASPDLLRTCEIEPWSVREIADALNARGIPCRLEPFQRHGRPVAVQILVRHDDFPGARDAVAEVLARRAPEYAERQILEAPDTNSCPACAEPLDPSAVSCAACGLAFPETIPE